jgi:hypothetical protein
LLALTWSRNVCQCVDPFDPVFFSAHPQLHVMACSRSWGRAEEWGLLLRAWDSCMAVCLMVCLSGQLCRAVDAHKGRSAWYTALHQQAHRTCAKCVALRVLKAGPPSDTLSA